MPKPGRDGSQGGKGPKHSGSARAKPWSVEDAQLRFRDLLQAAGSEPQEIQDGSAVYRIEKISQKKSGKDFLLRGGPLTDDDLNEP